MSAAETKARRNREIAQIHTLAKQLGLDESTRRLRMQRVGGSRSAAELTGTGRRAVISDFRNELGRQTKNRGRPRRQRPRHQRMIVGLWLEAYDKGAVDDKRDRAIDAFVERQTGVAKLDWLPADQAEAVIEPLKDMIRRRTRHG